MSNWISVKDRLPDEIGIYIVYVKGAEESTAALYNPVFERLFSGGGFAPIDESASFAEAVTHWMPLPAPPEEATHD